MISNIYMAVMQGPQFFEFGCIRSSFKHEKVLTLTRTKWYLCVRWCVLSAQRSRQASNPHGLSAALLLTYRAAGVMVL